MVSAISYGGSRAFVANSATVIKLKQVEHVRNERKTLAAVIGHPFITSLVASFSDEQCLYMLVRNSFSWPRFPMRGGLIVATAGLLPRGRDFHLSPTRTPFRRRYLEVLCRRNHHDH